MNKISRDKIRCHAIKSEHSSSKDLPLKLMNQIKPIVVESRMTVQPTVLKGQG